MRGGFPLAAGRFCHFSSGVNCSPLTAAQPACYSMGMVNSSQYSTQRARAFATTFKVAAKSNFDETKLSVVVSRPETTMGGINCRFQPEVNVRKMTEF